ncbi:hypothetical protein B0T18DRAFT_429875 [Schizothecium vesticola]|uniref:Uncharacterized protein n=1 Tax=Schizothecium vesticola TaxID=314040 RepID=A0AA40EWX3_9PEZI|nr:hypothetical protein B0T18DRAFT_429875 [Schizothecium vesticola]
MSPRVSHRAHFLPEITRSLSASHLSFTRPSSPSPRMTRSPPSPWQRYGVRSTSRHFILPPRSSQGNTPTYRVLVPAPIVHATMASTGEADAITRNGNLYVGRDEVMLAGLVGVGVGVGAYGGEEGGSKEVMGLSRRCGRTCGRTYGLREEGVGEDFGGMKRVMGRG